MMDLILHANNKATIRTFAQNNPPANPLLVQVDDGEGGTEWVTRDGLEWSWWADGGKVMTAKGTYDQDGNEITPPTFLGGVVALLRIHSDFFLSDRIIPDEADPDKEEQWTRSKVVKHVKDNGTGPSNFDLAGTNVPYYELDGVKITKPDKLDEALVAAGLPRHEFMGGNTY
jgi:hypothetical protein